MNLNRSYVFCSALCLVLFSCNSDRVEKNRIDLNLGWMFLDAEGDWLAAKVPGNVHLDLLEHGLISDPFVAVNEGDVQWVETVDWRYRRPIAPPPVSGEWALEFSGLDTYATVMLNGDTLLQSDNMHRRWRIPASEMVFTGTDTLSVVFKSPVAEGQRQLDAHPWRIPVSNEIRPQGEQVSAVVRKAMYHFGWDWGPRLVTSGIWRPVSWVRQDVALPEFSMTLDSLSSNTAVYRLQFEEPVTALSGELEMGGQDIPISLNAQDQGAYAMEIADPQLWWPHGMGEQPLYRLTLTDGAGRSVVHRFGIRRLDWVQEPDEFGTSFQCLVNGVPVQARGANIIPPDFFVNRGEEQLDRMLDDAVASHMNMLRIWGGAVYGSDAFYDRCDSLGILVWQDFMNACAMVPGDPAWQANFLAEAEEQVVRLRNRTSLALWCGNNETEKAWKEWGWQELYGMDAADSAAAWQAYVDLFEVGLPNVVASKGGGFYWPSSPSPVDPAQHRMAGDQHDWGVWFGKEGFDFFTRDGGRFASEFGLQSLPDRRTLEAVGVQSFSDTVLQFRQRSKMDWLEPGFDGWDMMQFYADGYFADPKAVEAEGMDELDRWIHLTQLTQAEGLRQAIERHRCSDGRTSGSLYWQLDDVWPTVSWSTVDHAGRWKLAHHAVRDANQPLRVLWDRSRTDALRMVGQNLGPTPWRGKLAWALLNLSGDTLKTMELVIDLPAFGERDKPFMTQDVPDDAAVVAWSLRTEEGAWVDRGASTLKPASAYEWKDAEVQIMPAEGGVWIESDALLCGVQLRAEAEGRFEDNGFMYLPGARRWIGFANADTAMTGPGAVRLAHLGMYREK